MLDRVATLPVVISDTQATYLYGLDIIAQQQAEAQMYYYMHDGLGSVRQLTDATGQVAASYAYDPFAVPLCIHLRLQDGEIGQVPVLLLIVQAIPYHKDVRKVEPYVVQR